ncbi:MAG: DUF3500 domain-containing protein [Proteobacteria bacterium]|nr:DUF3500 domain-containing protein [Pseudomonadota bacterium]
MTKLFMQRLLHTLCLLPAVLFLQVTTAQPARVELSQEMVAAANTFLGSLSEFQRSKGIYEFDDEERLNWHFIPRDRNGIPLKSMTEAERRAAEQLLQTFFSAKGYQKSEAVRGLEAVLAEIEVNGRFDRDPELYYLTVFGTPGMDTQWALRYEGHHQAFNWTFVRGMGIASSPQFFGSNPAEVRAGPKLGTRVLHAEEDLARDLVTSLDSTQAAQAILLMDAPRDIFTGAEKEITALDDVGVSFAALNSRQKRLLISIIEELTSTQPSAIAEQRMAMIREDGMDSIKFVWIGSTERGDAHYYRVQGPGFLIEYDNTQNNANHVHLVWRDFAGDFGRDLLRMHYDAVAAEFGPGHRH